LSAGDRLPPLYACNAARAADSTGKTAGATVRAAARRSTAQGEAMTRNFLSSCALIAVVGAAGCSLHASGSPTDATLQDTSPVAVALLADGEDSDGDRLPDSVETNTGQFISSSDTGTDPNDSDTDSDGLTDGDEVLGTTKGLNLPALGANPVRRSIFVEYDWFDDSIGCGNHSHRPTAAMIARVTNAFLFAPLLNPDGSTGADIIHDYGQGGLFRGGNRIRSSDAVIEDGLGSTEYANHRRYNFASNRDGIFHYVLLPHQYSYTRDGFVYWGSSGSGTIGPVSPKNVLVTVQCWGMEQDYVHTIVHELGHNFGLLHGGFEDVNRKPNYNSVMNYRFQLPGLDIDCLDNPLGGGDGWLDYSRSQMADLDENNLSEPAGICGDAAWDWNGNGEIDEGPVQADINLDSMLSVLQGSNDWEHVLNPESEVAAFSDEIEVCDGPN
jgi:hypothetical protein